MPPSDMSKEICTFADVEQALREVVNFGKNHSGIVAYLMITSMTTAENPKIQQAIAHIWIAENIHEDINKRVDHINAGLRIILELRSSKKMIDPRCEKYFRLLEDKAVRLVNSLGIGERAVERWEAMGYFEGYMALDDGSGSGKDKAKVGIRREGKDNAAELDTAGWVDVPEDILAMMFEVSELGDEFVLVD